jgi:hypothetical protein
MFHGHTSEVMVLSQVGQPKCCKVAKKSLNHQENAERMLAALLTLLPLLVVML